MAFGELTVGYDNFFFYIFLFHLWFCALWTVYNECPFFYCCVISDFVWFRLCSCVVSYGSFVMQVSMAARLVVCLSVSTAMRQLVSACQCVVLAMI